jgi:hypothetical protein
VAAQREEGWKKERRKNLREVVVFSELVLW